MEPIPLEMITRQVADLGNLVRAHFPAIDRSVQAAFPPEALKRVRAVYLVGDGDSFHAALSAELAFLELAGVMVYPREAMRFLEYSLAGIDLSRPAGSLVVGISASGGTERVFQAVEKAAAAHAGLPVAALVGNPAGRIAGAARTVISTQVPPFGPSPGIRTYHASLLGMLALAIRIGEAHGRLDAAQVRALHQEILDLSAPLEQFAAACGPIAAQAATGLTDVPFISCTGSGPSFGAAAFSGAKLTEIAGLFAPGQDLEEWAHVEGLGYPLHFPVFMVAPAGKGSWRADKLATLVTSLGHPLLAVAPAGNADLRAKASAFFPLPDGVRECFSPLLTTIPASLLAAGLAEKWGRTPFMAPSPHA